MEDGVVFWKEVSFFALKANLEANIVTAGSDAGGFLFLARSRSLDFVYIEKRYLWYAKNMVEKKGSVGYPEVFYWKDHEMGERGEALVFSLPDLPEDDRQHFIADTSIRI